MNAQAKTTEKLQPFVLVNMAMTADGKIATANRAIHSFGSARDLRHLYELRATADAVMCGARTVETSGSIMDSGGERYRQERLRLGRAECNLRVIVSGSGSVDLNAPIFQTHFSPVIVLTTSRISRGNRAKLEKLGTEVKTFGHKNLNLRAALRWLRSERRVKRLLCEGGGELNDALFRADLVDEIHLTICPMIFGGRIAPTIADGEGFPRLALAKKFELRSIHKFKSELFTVFSRQISR